MPAATELQSGTVTAPSSASVSPPTPRERLDTVRSHVRSLLSRTASFRALPPEQQVEIARNTVEIIHYLGAPEGIPADKLARLNREATARPLATPLAERVGGRRGRDAATTPEFKAQGAREGAAVAGLLLQQVNFPAFVSGLIEGVFTSIVDSSIRQMEAYANLVKSVAQTLNQFRDENVTANQGRDYLTEQFPDTFRIEMDTGGGFGEESTGPRVRLRDGVEEEVALAQVNSLPIEGGPFKSLDLEDDATENKLVQAARTQLATSRQQLLATMVLMGINRIIVTEGRIAAKVMYDFRARDNFQYQRSATQFDYDPTLKKRSSEGQYDYGREGGESEYEEGNVKSRRDASYWSKGQWKWAEEPVMTLASAEQLATTAELQTRANLAGSVEVNFKSETFPLEKMADSFQVARIQDASRPRSAASPTAAAGTPSTSGGTPAPSATAPTPTG